MKPRYYRMVGDHPPVLVWRDSGDQVDCYCGPMGEDEWDVSGWESGEDLVTNHSGQIEEIPESAVEGYLATGVVSPVVKPRIMWLAYSGKSPLATIGFTRKQVMDELGLASLDDMRFRGYDIRKVSIAPL